jgi:hypothetical protein
MFPKVGLLEKTKGEGTEEKNYRECKIIKYITSVEEQDTAKHTEN